MKSSWEVENYSGSVGRDRWKLQWKYLFIWHLFLNLFFFFFDSRWKLSTILLVWLWLIWAGTTYQGSNLYVYLSLWLHLELAIKELFLSFINNNLTNFQFWLRFSMFQARSMKINLWKYWIPESITESGSNILSVTLVSESIQGELLWKQQEQKSSLKLHIVRFISCLSWFLCQRQR